MKNLRNNLRPFISTILQSLQPHLIRIMNQPLSEGSSSSMQGAASGSLSSSSNAMRDTANANKMGGKPTTSVVDDRLYVFEAVGLLLGQEEIPIDEQQQLLLALLQPLREQIEKQVTLCSPSSPGLILQALEAVVRLNKGFRTDLCTRIRPHLGESTVHQHNIVCLDPFECLCVFVTHIMV